MVVVALPRIAVVGDVIESDGDTGRVIDEVDLVDAWPPTQIVGSTVGPLIGLVPMTSAVPMGVAILTCASLSAAALWLVLRPRSIPNVLAA